MTNAISNTDNTIDSRDAIARIEELEQERANLESELDNAHDDIEVGIAEGTLKEFDNSEEGQELTALKQLAEQAESSPDWTYGETLINEDYFTQYIEELIDDCYEIPKEFNSGEWPWRHMSIDYEAAAEEAKQDYMEVDFNGTTFLIRA